MIQLAWLSDQLYLISYQTCANTLRGIMVLMVQSLMTQNPINHHPSSGPGPHLILHHLLRGCGLQSLQSQTLFTLLTLKGGVD